MSRYAFKLPDLGEGTVAAEIVSWMVKPGDQVAEGATIAEMATEKAVVELPAPVSGEVVSLAGAPGDSVAVGAELIVFETAAAAEAAAAGYTVELGNRESGIVKGPAPLPASAPAKAAEPSPAAVMVNDASAAKVMASPATRRRAREAGIDLRLVAGSGRGGRIVAEDLEQVIRQKAQPAARAPARADAGLGQRTGVEEIKVIGVRRVIAQRMSESSREIPHFSYVEEVDVTELEALRTYLNAKAAGAGERLNILPFIVAALARVLERFPQCNAHYDRERELLLRHRAVHVGIATQTRDGLKVPVLRHAESRTVQDISAEIRRLAEAARSNRATRAELSGSTITVTSLGRIGGIVTTPVINLPEVAIIGVNKVAERPVVRGGAVTVRQMMNLSSSFDHRFVDGFDAAEMIQALRECLEHPATIFMRV